MCSAWSAWERLSSISVQCPLSAWCGAHYKSVSGAYDRRNQVDGRDRALRMVSRRGPQAPIYKVRTMKKGSADDI